MRRRTLAALLLIAVPSLARAQQDPPAGKERGNNGNKGMSNTSKGGGTGNNVNNKFNGAQDNKKKNPASQ